MFPLPKTPHRPAAQDILPPSVRRQRIRNKHPSRSPPRLRGSKVYRRRAPKLRPAPVSFTQDASPAVGSNDSPDVPYELKSPSSPLDRYNPTKKTAYKQLMIHYVPSSSKLPNPSTSDSHNQRKRASMSSGSQREVASAQKRTKFVPPEEVDDGVFFSSDPIPSTFSGLFGHPQPITLYLGPSMTPARILTKESAHTMPLLSLPLDLDVLDLQPPYYRFQADSTTDDLLTNLHHPPYPTPLAHHADGPAFAYYID
jgi:hypothetical protein